jgi:hypothetical protein
MTIFNNNTKERIAMSDTIDSINQCICEIESMLLEDTEAAATHVKRKLETLSAGIEALTNEGRFAEFFQGTESSESAFLRLLKILNANNKLKENDAGSILSILKSALLKVDKEVILPFNQAVLRYALWELSMMGSQDDKKLTPYSQDIADIAKIFSLKFGLMHRVADLAICYFSMLKEGAVPGAEVFRMLISSASVEGESCPEVFLEDLVDLAKGKGSLPSESVTGLYFMSLSLSQAICWNEEEAVLEAFHQLLTDLKDDSLSYGDLTYSESNNSDLPSVIDLLATALIDSARRFDDSRFQKMLSFCELLSKKSNSSGLSKALSESSGLGYLGFARLFALLKIEGQTKMLKSFSGFLVILIKESDASVLLGDLGRGAFQVVEKGGWTQSYPSCLGLSSLFEMARESNEGADVLFEVLLKSNEVKEPGRVRGENAWIAYLRKDGPLNSILKNTSVWEESLRVKLVARLVHDADKCTNLAEQLSLLERMTKPGTGLGIIIDTHVNENILTNTKKPTCSRKFVNLKIAKLKDQAAGSTAETDMKGSDAGNFQQGSSALFAAPQGGPKDDFALNPAISCTLGGNEDGGL